MVANDGLTVLLHKVNGHDIDPDGSVVPAVRSPQALRDTNQSPSLVSCDLSFGLVAITVCCVTPASFDLNQNHGVRLTVFEQQVGFASERVQVSPQDAQPGLLQVPFSGSLTLPPEIAVG